MEENLNFNDHFDRCTTFVQSEKAVWLRRLCGFECGLNGSDSGPWRASGLLALETVDERFADNDFQQIAWQTGENTLEVEWAVGKTGLKWKSKWELQPATGIWSRQDLLVNGGEKTLQVTRALARFPLAPGRFEIYAQESSWAHENQGKWIVLPTGELTLRSQAGRTNQGATPYLFLRLQGTAHGIAFHILPQGNWVIHVDRSYSAGNPHAPSTVVEMGLSDDRLQLEIPANATFELPEILIQAVPFGEPEMGAPALQRYALQRFFPKATVENTKSVKSFAPLIYNTWFDAFEFLEIGRMRDQLVAAREVGCEVFVVDAGWYGNGAGPWDRQVGDWSEKQSGAFHGRMAEFAQDVRAAGLGFGLWMEPERFAAGVPSLAAHPDWFLACPWGYFSPDLSQQPVRDLLLSEISYLVETYQLAWMKIDFNLEMGHAADGLTSYYQAWYGVLDELRKRFPETFFEGCASGGMRLDLNTLAHFDGHFLSDTVNPVDILRISQGAFLRVPPGRLTRWAVLRPAGRRIPRYGQPLGQALERMITPGGSNWEDSVIADVDFICRAALPGMFGYSGDLAGLSVETRARLRYHSAFYQRWREFLAGCFCHLLTPIRNLEDRDGWIALQLQNPHEQETNQILVYRLNDGIHQKRIQLRGLDPEHFYTVTNEDTPNEPPLIFSGRELTSIGLPVELPSKFSAGVYILQPKPG